VNRTTVLLAAAAVMAAGTWLVGWAAVPLIGIAYGLLRHEERAIEWKAALAGALAWGGLLAFQSMHGDVIRTAAAIGGVFSLGGIPFLLVTLAFAAILAGAAAGTGRGLARIGRRRPMREGRGDLTPRSVLDDPLETHSRR
jgi:hypothetical protein